MPFTFTPLQIALRTTARIAAFIPGASPPLVRIPIVFILDAIAPPVLRHMALLGLPLRFYQYFYH